MLGDFLDGFLPVHIGLCEEILIEGVEFFHYLVMISYRDAFIVLQLGNAIDVSAVRHRSVKEFCVALPLFEPLDPGFLPP